MGSQSSSQAQVESTINGQPAIFFYKRADDLAERELSFTLGYKAYPNSTWTRIPYNNIIVVLPTPNQAPNYSVLYVEKNAASENDLTASPVLFRSIVASNLPQTLIHDLAPSGNACWKIRNDPAQVQPNLHVVVSTLSGTQQATSVWEQVLKPMLDHLSILPGTDYVLHHTTSDTTVTEFTRDVILPQANLGVRQGIVLLSGDGGMVDVTNALLSRPHSANYRNPSVSLLPLGTGNALAHSAGITTDNTLGLRNMWFGIPKAAPLFRATFSPGARLLCDEAREERPLSVTSNDIPTAHGSVVASWAFHAGLVADSDTAEYRKFGVERFKMAAKEALFPSDGSPMHAYKGTVSILERSGTEDVWRRVERDTHNYVLATFCSYLEKGFNISPASKQLDGKLRLVHLGAVGGQEAMNVIMKAYDGGKHVDEESIGYQEIQGFRIDIDEEDARWRRICIDGKIVRVEQGGWVEVRSDVEPVVSLIVM